MEYSWMYLVFMHNIVVKSSSVQGNLQIVAPRKGYIYLQPMAVGRYVS